MGVCPSCPVGNRKNCRVTVVCGGISSEREVSLRSGSAVAEALRAGGYRFVDLFDLNRQNLGELLAGKPEIVFLALHGKGGEDGCIQGALELAGIPYTGSGVESSALCMDKIRTKQVLKSERIPTPGFVILGKEEFSEAAREETLKKLSEKIGFPMVLKSPSEGSSIGVVIVRAPGELFAGAEEVLRYGDSMIVEEFIEGAELTLPILGTAVPEALPVIEITSEGEFYDYHSKYTPGQSHHIIPARIREADRALAVKRGLAAYRAMGCRGLARVDLMNDAKRGPLVIELNTLPGMTAVSLFPDAAGSVGISFPELCDRIVRTLWEED